MLSISSAVLMAENWTSNCRILAVPLLCLVLALPAYPWGATGHHVVALIAQRRLSPEVRDRIDRLLFNGRYSIRDIAACADQIRSGSPKPGAKAYPVDETCNIVAGEVKGNTGPWHYIDIPVPTKETDLEKFCPKGDCVVDQIERFAKILHDSNDDRERRVALLFIVHFMGDIHQPLHAAERACDQGGNKELVNFYLGEEERADVRLHSVWDTDLVNKLMKDSGLDDEQALTSDLASRIDDVEAQRWARATAPQIAWESYRIAKKRVYRGIPFQDFCDKDVKAGAATNLTAGYENSGKRIVREQLMKAGVRLAAILEQNVTH
jgi:hypothetical protein